MNTVLVANPQKLPGPICYDQKAEDNIKLTSSECLLKL